MLVRINFTLFRKYSRKSNENLCKGLLTCTSFYCDRKQWVWQLFNKLATQQHGLYIIPKHYINCGIQARWSRACMVIFHGWPRDNMHIFWQMGASRFQNNSKFKFPNFMHIFKWPQIWHKGGQSHAKWSMIAPRALPIWFEIFKKELAKTKI